MTFLSKEVPSVSCRNISDFRKGLIQIKMCLYKKNYFLLRKHTVWGKFIVLARPLISGCQKVLVWTKICCNKKCIVFKKFIGPMKTYLIQKDMLISMKNPFVLMEIVWGSAFLWEIPSWHWNSLRKMNRAVIRGKTWGEGKRPLDQ